MICFQCVSIISGPSLRYSLSIARGLVTCRACSVAFLTFRSGSTRVYSRSLRTSGTSHAVRCAQRTGLMSQIRGKKWPKTAAALVTPCIDMDSGTGKLWTPKTHRGGGDKRRELSANSSSPVRNCASSYPRDRAERFVLCGVRSLSYLQTLAQGKWARLLSAAVSRRPPRVKYRPRYSVIGNLTGWM